MVALCGCRRKSVVFDDTSPDHTDPVNRPEPPADQRAAVPQPPPPAELWNEFSGDKAFAHVKQLTDLGPRPAGSRALEQARGIITTALEQHRWRVERQEFEETTPRGTVHFINLVARFAPAGVTKPARSDTQRIIVASHYDTKLFETIRFVGANDGGSSTGALMELARVLSLDPALATRMELVFFDGEEAFTQFTETDGLYGSRFYARQLTEAKRNTQFLAGVVWDMIGDKDLTITLSPDTPPRLAREFFEAADALGIRDRFTYNNRPVFDDHVPLNRAHIPTIDIIDFDYLPWHTADDTLDKVSAESLETIGRVTLYYLRRVISK